MKKVNIVIELDINGRDDEMFEMTDPDVFREIRRKRKLASKERKWDQTSSRHKVRETVKKAQIEHLERKL